MSDDITIPTISYVDGALPAIVQEAEEYLIASEVPVYQRDGKIVRVGRFPIHDGHPSLSFVELTKDALVELFTTIIQWRKFDGRKGEEKVVNCPDRVAMTYQSRSGKWRLPVIRSIITTPTLRQDGSLLEEPGYDRVTGLYFDPQGIRFPSISVAPAKDDAHQALKYILGFVSEVPFVVDDDYGDINRSVFLSGLLSALVRPILPAVPLHGFNAPAAGSGKSILVNAITSVVTGSPASPISQGSEEEMVKTLSSALQAGYRFISFDNCEHPLGGAVLCQAVSEPYLSLRVFGKTELKQISNTAMYFATANNLMFTGDMVRRALRCTIDAGCERPEERKFKTLRPDIAMANNRVEIVVAGLTILRAFFHAGCPKQSEPAGNFER
jgi:putative DNA primase/helicase